MSQCPSLSVYYQREWAEAIRWNSHKEAFLPAVYQSSMSFSLTSGSLHENRFMIKKINKKKRKKKKKQLSAHFALEIISSPAILCCYHTNIF